MRPATKLLEKCIEQCQNVVFQSLEKLFVKGNKANVSPFASFWKPEACVTRQVILNRTKIGGK